MKFHLVLALVLALGVSGLSAWAVPASAQSMGEVPTGTAPASVAASVSAMPATGGTFHFEFFVYGPRFPFVVAVPTGAPTLRSPLPPSAWPAASSRVRGGPVAGPISRAGRVVGR
jgi:hypothetical protein